MRFGPEVGAEQVWAFNSSSKLSESGCFYLTRFSETSAESMYLKIL